METSSEDIRQIVQYLAANTRIDFRCRIGNTFVRADRDDVATLLEGKIPLRVQFTDTEKGYFIDLSEATEV